MGYTRPDAATWSSYSTSTAHKTATDYTTRTASALKDDYRPTKFQFRESRRSDINPNPTPVIVSLDASGSMGRVVEAMRKGLGTLFLELVNRKPVSDPHVLATIIGDFDTDREPVQVTQFEADPVTVGRQIEELWLEGNGGGNAHEGYLGPLYFAAMRTRCDAFPTRKGFLFTVGDEEPEEVLRAAAVEKFFGDKIERDLTADELLTLVRRNWHYFHVMVEEGSHMGMHRDRVLSRWRHFIGQSAIPLADHTKLAEVVISTIEVVAGRDRDDVVKSWSGSTALVVAEAIKGLPANAGGSGPVALT